MHNPTLILKLLSVRCKAPKLQKDNCNMLRRGILNYICRYKSTEKLNTSVSFETVFSFPYIKYIAIINRLKVYHLYGSGVTIPSCGLLEMLNVVPDNTFIAGACIGISGGVLLSLASVSFRNVIGFLYVSEDNKLVKISAVDFWGNRKDRIVDVNDWIPLCNITPKIMDAVYLTPHLTDGTKYKLLVKYGKITNPQKMGQVLE